MLDYFVLKVKFIVKILDLTDGFDSAIIKCERRHFLR